MVRKSSTGEMSKAKWFVVRKSSTGEIIGTSANQIVPPEIPPGGTKNVVLYSPDPPFLLEGLRGGSGFETIWNINTTQCFIVSTY